MYCLFQRPNWAIVVIYLEIIALDILLFTYFRINGWIRSMTWNQCSGLLLTSIINYIVLFGRQMH